MVERNGTVSTINDVAKEAGVSKTTVSFVLTGFRPVSKETEAKVRAAMDKLGYVANHSAQSLSTSKTNTLGVITSNRQGAYFELARGTYINWLSKAATNAGYDMLIVNDPDGTATANVCQSHKADGLIFLDVRRQDPRIPFAAKSGIPTVCLGVPDDWMDLDVVDTDFGHAASSIIGKLAAEGHTNICLITLPQPILDQKLNDTFRFIQSAKRTSQRLHLALSIRTCTTDAENIENEVADILSTQTETTAYVIQNESAILVFHHLLETNNIPVPQQYSVVVSCEKQMSDALYMPFSALQNDVKLVTETALRTLINHIKHPNRRPQFKLLQGQYVDRDTVAPVSPKTGSPTRTCRTAGGRTPSG